MRVLCAIPCYNEDIAIAGVVLRATKHVDEVLVVDDGSSDDTVKLAKQAGATVIVHGKNQGKGGAYRTFWNYAVEHKFDALVTLDGDGQHNADEIPRLLRELEKGADFVIGSRWGEKTQMPTWRKVGKRILDYTTAAASKQADLTDSQSGFRAYSQKALKKIKPRTGGFGVESQLLVDATEKKLQFAETRISCRYDVDSSTLGPVRHASGVINDILTEIGIRHPLLLLGLPGLILLILGGGAGINTVYILDVHGYFSPAWMMVSMFLTTVGLMMIMMGMVFHLIPRAVKEHV